MRLVEKISKEIKFQQNRNLKIVAITILILVSGIIQWKMGFVGSESMIGETDAFYRLTLIQEYLKSGESFILPFIKLPLEGVWLSGYFSIFVILGKMGLGEIGFRIVTWLCGLLLTLPLWLIANKLIKNNGGIVWQLLVLYAFMMSPLMLQINMEMLAEPVAGFLLIWSLYFLLDRKNIWSIFFLFLSQSTRYEAWFIVPFYWIFVALFNNGKNTKNKIFMFIGTLVFPLIWIILNLVQSNDSLNFYVTRQKYLDQVFISQYGNVLVALSEWTSRLQQYISFEWFSLWIFANIWIAVKGSREQKWWSWLSIYSFVIVVLQLWLKSTEWFAPRFIYLVYTLSVPIVLISIDITRKEFQKAELLGKIVIIFILFWFVNQYIQGIPKVTESNNAYFIPNQEVKQITNNLKSEIFVKDNSKKVIYLWMEASPWLAADFNYYLINVNGWENVEKVKDNNDLAIMKKGDLVVADRGLIEWKKFSKLTGNYLFEVWLKGD